MRRVLACTWAVVSVSGSSALVRATEADVPHTPTASTPGSAPRKAEADAPRTPTAVSGSVPFKSDTSGWGRDRPQNGYWSQGTPRFFLSTKSDVGGIYVKPYLSLGYGLPHWIWTGVDVNAITTPEFAQFYSGIRGSTPLFDIALGLRDTYSYWKPFLEPRRSFVAADLRNPSPNAHYWAWEGEVVGVIPLPHAAILLDYIAVGVLNRPAGKYLYEESYRAVVGKSFFQVLRMAVVARLLREDSLKLGVLTELVTTTGRGEPVFRMGPAAALQLTDHLEMLGTLSLKVASPDRLGLALGAYGVSGFRYRWATGEKAPKAPWRGRLIP
jgi:hypothetical protein